MMPILAGNNEKEQGMKHTHHSPIEPRWSALCLCIALTFSAAPLSRCFRLSVEGHDPPVEWNSERLWRALEIGDQGVEVLYTCVLPR